MISKIKLILFISVPVIVIGGLFLYRSFNQYDLPSGETVVLEPTPTESPEDMNNQNNDNSSKVGLSVDRSNRTTFLTDGVKHSVPLDEILSGGPAKDGIPSIDDPQFISINEANKWLDDSETGSGLCLNGDCRFYPYQILVFHEIVNDIVAKQPVLITYCPLCLTGIVFDRKLNDEIVEFGTSGKLWKSNLVMYNRTDNSEEESLWSQVLGEAIVGEFTGTKLDIIPSDVIRYGDWKKLHSDTQVLSRDTGTARNYGRDPYGDYYTSERVSFGADFKDDRLHPKAYVLGININGEFKAYESDALKVGETEDNFNGETITINKKAEGEVRMFRTSTGSAQGAKEPLPYIGGFWFSWLAVHPETELHK